MKDEVFAFAYPWLLLGLLILPVLAILRGARGAAPAVVFSSLAPLRNLGRQRRASAGGWLTTLLLLALGLFVVAMARPQAARTLTHIESSGIDIVLTLDVSPSMKAEDFTIGNQRANRLEAVKQVTEKFIRGRPNDRIGIVAFAGRPYLVSPLTLDHDWLLQNLQRIQIGMVGDATAIGSALASAANRIKDRESKSKIVVLLTDGDSNAGQIPPLTAAEAAKALKIKVYTICAGAKGLVPYPTQDMFGRTVYRNVNMPVDETSLREIAKIADGQFYRATDSKSLAQIFEDIDRLEKTTEQFSQYKEYRELFPWFIGAGGGLLALYLMLSQTLWRRLP